MSVAKKVVSYTVLSFFIAAPFLALWQRQNLYDTWRLHNYIAPNSIVKLADVTTMNPLGRKIFYVERPELQDKETFRTNCTTSEQTIVLGCYKLGSGIFVYNVADTRLDGVQEVTAAHEMLHAAYERLSSKEKDHIDTLTAAAFAKLTDDRIKKNVEAYRAKDPSVVPNELHSILGTEVMNLSLELETYYKRYFTNRQAIVTFSEQYEAEFSNRETAIKDYDQKLSSAKTTIDKLNSSLDAQGKAIDNEANRLQGLLSARDIASYNAGIPNYKQMIRNYNADLAKLKSTIVVYNSDVEKRNAIVGEEQSLFNELDTRVPATR